MVRNRLHDLKVTAEKGRMVCVKLTIKTYTYIHIKALLHLTTLKRFLNRNKIGAICGALP